LTMRCLRQWASRRWASPPSTSSRRSRAGGARRSGCAIGSPP
jgi:hypothetical protein